MKLFKAYSWTLPGLILLAGYLLLVNVFKGYDQQLEWGMKPPYHWVATNDSVDTTLYMGSNGKECATIYNYAGMWVVYGYGFNDNYDLKDEAEQVAYEYCY